MQECASGAALIIDSPGGDAQSAFQIAKLFRRHCGGFCAVVPRMAKSAATLVVLGADELMMGRDAELGPLDAQIFDPDREGVGSALDEVQALERLNSVALDLSDQAMFLLIGRTGKKVDTLLPTVMRFVSDLMNPLLDKIDTIHYTQYSRVLKVAEDYATRLLEPRYTEEQAKHIARRLVNNYSEHGFVLDKDEVGEMLTLTEPSPDVQSLVDTLEDVLTFDRSLMAIGRIQPKEA